MTKDRLSGIWNGFSQTSSLDLAGTSIDHTPRPPHLEEADPAPFGPADLNGAMPGEAHGRRSRAGYGARASAPGVKGEAVNPVSAALTAMHSEMEQGQARRGKKREAPPAVDHSAPPTSRLEETLLADLAFTRSKTSRRGGDYLSYAAARQDAWQRRKRKKFLGIF